MSIQPNWIGIKNKAECSIIICVFHFRHYLFFIAFLGRKRVFFYRFPPQITFSVRSHFGTAFRPISQLRLLCAPIPFRSNCFFNNDQYTWVDRWTCSPTCRSICTRAPRRSSWTQPRPGSTAWSQHSTLNIIYVYFNRKKYSKGLKLVNKWNLSTWSCADHVVCATKCEDARLV